MWKGICKQHNISASIKLEKYYCQGGLCQDCGPNLVGLMKDKAAHRFGDAPYGDAPDKIHNAISFHQNIHRKGLKDAYLALSISKLQAARLHIATT